MERTHLFAEDGDDDVPFSNDDGALYDDAGDFLGWISSSPRPGDLDGGSGGHGVDDDDDDDDDGPLGGSRGGGASSPHDDPLDARGSLGSSSAQFGSVPHRLSELVNGPRRGTRSDSYSRFEGKGRGVISSNSDSSAFGFREELLEAREQASALSRRNEYLKQRVRELEAIADRLPRKARQEREAWWRLLLMLSVLATFLAFGLVTLCDHIYDASERLRAEGQDEAFPVAVLSVMHAFASFFVIVGLPSTHLGGVLKWGKKWKHWNPFGGGAVSDE